MSLASKASKILTNKYFLYFIVFLAVTNVFGYLVMHKTNAVIFFAVVGIITYQFSKNMAVVLMVCLVATNLLMSSNVLREGLENATTTVNKDNVNKDNINKDTVKKVAVAKKINENKDENNRNPVDINNLDLNKIIASTDVEPSTTNVSGMSTMNNNKMNKKNGRIDYASTLEEAYDNLDKVLGGDGMKSLTQDTERLMKRQQELFKVMESMTPMLESAKGMLEGFDMNSLKGLTSLASGFSSTSKKEGDK